jgi:hypothetical protein
MKSAPNIEAFSVTLALPYAITVATGRARFAVAVNPEREMHSGLGDFYETSSESPV